MLNKFATQPGNNANSGSSSISMSLFDRFSFIITPRLVSTVKEELIQ